MRGPHLLCKQGGGSHFGFVTVGFLAWGLGPVEQACRGWFCGHLSRARAEEVGWGGGAVLAQLVYLQLVNLAHLWAMRLCQVWGCLERQAKASGAALVVRRK